ncbi:MAG: hypothetical protein ACK5KQ_01140 [Anaerorhabdus sp.]
MDGLLFKYEIKKLLSQTSTKVIALILCLFPITIVFGIVSPSQQFSITMGNFSTAADFSNAVLGFLNSLGFYYIILVVLSSSILSREIDSKYLYFMLSAVPKSTKVFLYKVISVSIVFTIMLALSSIIGYLAYSVLYLKELSFSIDVLGILSWGILISFIITITYMMLLTICNILTDGSIFASLTVAILTVVVLIILGGFDGVMYFLPAWAMDFYPDRNNILLLGIYLAVFVFSLYMMFLCTRKKRV